MITIQEKFEALEQNNEAVLAVNFYNFETLAAILRAAANQHSSVILQTTKSTINYLGLEVTAALARSAIKQSGVQAWLHLDHAQNIELIQRALDAGYDSVMIDASEKSFDENCEITRRVVKLAEPYNANVEAELGYIAKLGQSKNEIAFTQPDEAKTFVEKTGVDALAVAIGSAHGFYDKEPNMDIELLGSIHQKTPAYLVLHGGSGIPDGQLQNAIKNGIRKINLATEVKDGFVNTLRGVLPESDEIDLRKLFPAAIDHVQQLLEKKIAVVNSA